MSAVLHILFATIFTVAVCFSIGKLLLDRLRLKLYREEQYVFGFVAGAACLSAIVFALAAAHLVRKGVFLALGAAAILVAARFGAYRFAEPLPKLPRFWKILFAISFTAF